MKTYIQNVTAIKVTGSWTPIFDGSKLVGVEATQGCWVDITAEGDSNFRFKQGDKIISDGTGVVSIITT